MSQAHHVLTIEVCLRRNSGCSTPTTPTRSSDFHCSNGSLAAAIEMYIRSHHACVFPHSEIELLDNQGDFEISTQMERSLLSGEMTLAKAELAVGIYVKALYATVGGSTSRATGFAEVWCALGGMSDDISDLSTHLDKYETNQCSFEFVFYECVDDENLVDAFDGITLTPTKSLEGIESIACSLSESTLEGVTLTSLPNTKFDHLWTSLHFTQRFKSEVLGHARLSLALSKFQIHAMNNKLLVLYGPPGSGKTSVSKALAQKVSLHSKGVLIELSGARIFSKWFGESAQKLETIFNDLQSLIQLHPDMIFCILIDEIESLASSRSQIMDKNETTDAVRVVNTLLTKLDALKPLPNFIIFSTSNLLDSLDEAFLDRADEVFEVAKPDIFSTYNIVRQSINALITEGLILGEVIPLDVTGSEPSRALFEISKLCHDKKLSGRALTRSPLMILAKHQVKSNATIKPATLSQFLYWFISSVSGRSR